MTRIQKVILSFIILISSTLVFIGAGVVNAETFTKDLIVGSEGDQVVALQTLLIEKGFDIPSISRGVVVKGYFGIQTKNALIAYQKSIGLPAFGFFGKMTRNKILSKNDKNSALTVISPNGGEQLAANSPYLIKWNYANATSTSKVDLYLVTAYLCPRDKFPEIEIVCVPNKTIILDKNIQANASYNWLVGTDIVNNIISQENYFLKICVAGTNECDTSDKSFAITRARLPLMYSVTTDKNEYRQGEDIKIHYQVYNPTDKVVTLVFYSGCESAYRIGDFDSMFGAVCTANVPTEIINPYTAKSWDMLHKLSINRISEGDYDLRSMLSGYAESLATSSISIK